MTAAPLTGLVLTLWGMASAIRKTRPRWPGAGRAHVAAIGAAFSVVCALAAALAGAFGPVEPSIAWAAAAGLAWGVAAAAWTLRRGRLTSGDGLRKLASPGLVNAGVAAAGAAVWFLVAVVVLGRGLPLRELAGLVLLALLFLPNAVVGLVALGLGATVHVTMTVTVGRPLSGSPSLWDWPSVGLLPGSQFVLGAVPFVASITAGRAARRNGLSTLPGGLVAGGLLGAVLIAAGWIASVEGSLGGRDRDVIRAGLSAVPTFLLAVGWGVAGAFLARLPWPRPSRVEPT